MSNQSFKAVIVMSGGQDSATCLGVAITKYKSENLLAVSFDYGQKHRIELEAAAKICKLHDVAHVVVPVEPLTLMKSSALVTGGDTTQEHEYLKDLPASFVPVRNALFLTIAYGLAMENGAEKIYTGVCETDYSGYPDCRNDFVVALNNALNVGYQSTIDIVTPLMYLSKAETFALAKKHDFLRTVLEHTVTCYNGVTDVKHDWGKGCGTCPSCVLREKGWTEYAAVEA